MRRLSPEPVGGVSVRAHDRLHHDLVAPDLIEDLRQGARTESVEPDRRHDGDTAAGKVTEVTLVQIPPDEVERVVQRDARALDAGEGIQETHGIMLVVPRRADHHHVVILPANVRTPGHGLHGPTERVERLVGEFVVDEVAGRVVEGQECAAGHGVVVSGQVQ